MPGIYPLKGVVKYYDWGGYSFIPGLLGVRNEKQLPFAEYWMGIHPQGISLVNTKEDEWKELNQLAGRLPYLFKVLDVRDMLSIQVHPSKKEAETEFARENAAGIPLDSPQRNYKDDNHKPELMVALGDFWLVQGFKPTEELLYTLLNVVELRELFPVFNQSGYEGLYRYVMEMPQQEVNRILRPLVDNIASIYKDGPPDKWDEDYWAAKAAGLFSKNNDLDRGIFSIYFFNLVHLEKGEGIFQPAGVPHAYLEGKNVEIMANSDNVLRGGLTTKHIDVGELLKHVRCEAGYPQVLSGDPLPGPGKIYSIPVPDFELAVFEPGPGTTLELPTAKDQVFLATEGESEISDGENSLILRPGNPSAFVNSRRSIRLRSSGQATVFRASPRTNSGG